MIGGMSAVENDVIPYSQQLEIEQVTGINIVGLEELTLVKN